jgi:murein DD-endopeptidase MepM/ murein hydrolase activator NlpD
VSRGFSQGGSIIPSRCILTALVFWGGCFWAFALGADGQPADASSLAVLKGKQGEVLYLRLNVEESPLSIRGTFRNRPVVFFKTGERRFAALVGIDMADDPETSELKAELSYPDSVGRRVFRVAVSLEDFRVQRMTLPKGQVDPDAASLKRIAAEQDRIRRVLATSTTVRLWSKPFVVPAEGVATGAFGSKRILNGQPRNQHSGEDIAAPLGTPVKAANAGVVKMVEDHFFSGLSVIVDHGLGLFTMYFHLDTAAVAEGQTVDRGQLLGTVGKSGRASGPHLHWGAWLNGSRVNPFALTTLPLDLVNAEAP